MPAISFADYDVSIRQLIFSLRWFYFHLPFLRRHARCFSSPLRLLLTFKNYFAYCFSPPLIIDIAIIDDIDINAIFITPLLMPPLTMPYIMTLSLPLSLLMLFATPAIITPLYYATFIGWYWLFTIAIAALSHYFRFHCWCHAITPRHADITLLMPLHISLNIDIYWIFIFLFRVHFHYLFSDAIIWCRLHFHFDCRLFLRRHYCRFLFQIIFFFFHFIFWWCRDIFLPFSPSLIFSFAFLSPSSLFTADYDISIDAIFAFAYADWLPRCLSPPPDFPPPIHDDADWWAIRFRRRHIWLRHYFAIEFTIFLRHWLRFLRRRIRHDAAGSLIAISLSADATFISLFLSSSDYAADCFISSFT